MKTTELRIGNYVNGIYDEGEFIAEVLTVDSEGCLLDANGIYELTSLKVIKPIPLTEEWLVKFGFERLGDISFPFIKSNDFENSETFSLYGIKHVHQLQNLYFALTGEELKTKL